MTKTETSKSIDYRYYHWGPLLYHVSLPKDKLENLKKLCVRNIKKDARKGLAGHLGEEYFIDEKKFFHITWEYFLSYIKAYKTHLSLEVGNKVEIINAWVNFMKASECNPPHAHQGDISCIIYTHIPPEIKKEWGSNISTSGGAGSVEFFGFPSLDGRMYRTLHNFFPEEGDFFIFPASLWHYVTPFKTSGIERISISANLKIPIEKEKENNENK